MILPDPLDLPSEAYPLTVTYLHAETRKVLWTIHLEAPAPGERHEITVPGQDVLQAPVITRIEFGDGTVLEDPEERKPS